MSIPRATTLGYGFLALALAAMCVTMPTELGIIAATVVEIAGRLVGVLTWGWVG